MDDRKPGVTAVLMVLGCVVAVIGLLLVYLAESGVPDGVAWVVTVIGALVFHAGLIGYAVRN